MPESLEYADSRYFRRYRVPKWLTWLPAWVLAVTVIVPPTAEFLKRYYYVGWLDSDFVDALLVAVMAGSIGVAIVAYVQRARERGKWEFLSRRLIGPSVMLMLALAAPVMLNAADWRGAILGSHYHNIGVDFIERRANMALQRLERIRGACGVYAGTHGNHEGRPFPPHLATLVAGGYLKPEDLVDPSSATVPMILPPGITEAAWPSIAADVDAHCDFVYLGADIRIDDTRFGPVVIGYSKIAHFHRGELVCTVGEGEWVRYLKPGEFSTVWTASNQQRERIFLPALTMGAAPPATLPVTTYALAAPRSADQAEMDAHIFRYRGDAIRCAILNYATEHEGHYPPHLAALIAGHYIRATDLLYPAMSTPALWIDTSKMTETDWPKIAAEVDAHSDVIYCSADLSPDVANYLLNPPDKRFHQLVMFYVKPLAAADFFCVYCQPALGMEYAGTLADCFTYGRMWRQVFVNANEVRQRFDLPRLQPNVPPPYSIPSPPAPGLPKGPDQAAINKEISRRNVAVLVSEHPGWNSATEPAPGLIGGGSISPRHLHDPDRNTPVIDFDAPELASRHEPFTEAEIAAELKYVEPRSDYVLPSYRVASFKAPLIPEIRVYSKNTYGNTGRICGYSNGEARFVSWEELPEELRNADQR